MGLLFSVLCAEYPAVNPENIPRIMHTPAAGRIPSSQFKAFQQHLQKRDLAATTIRCYLHDLKLFDRWLSELLPTTASALTQVGTPELAAYRKFLIQDRSHKATTVNRRINALRAFFGWLQKEQARADNPAEQLRFVRRATRPRPKSLQRHEVLALMRAAADSLQSLGVRNSALLQLMLQTGMRAAEVVALQWADVTLQARSGVVHVRAGKGLKEREIPLNATARDALSRYRKTTAPHSLEAFVFQSKRETPLSVRALQDVIASIARRAKVSRLTVSAHSLRHTFAANYLASNPGKLVELATLMGHDSLNTTAIYLRPSEEDLASDLERSALNVLGE